MGSCLDTAVFLLHGWDLGSWIFWSVAGLQLWMEEGEEHLGIWQEEQGKVVWSWPCSQTRALGWAVQCWCASCFGFSGHLSPCYIAAIFSDCRGWICQALEKQRDTNNCCETTCLSNKRDTNNCCETTHLSNKLDCLSCVLDLHFSELVSFCQVLSELHGN